MNYYEPFFGGGALLFHLKESPKLVKWVGGKEKLLPQLMPHFAVDLHQVKRHVVSDDNLRLVRTYRAVRDSPAAVIDALKAHAAAYAIGGEATYYKVRSLDPEAMPDHEAAAWFIFLNRTGYNGLYRVHQKKGTFNVPHGKWARPPVICDEARILAVSRALAGVLIEHRDFAAMVEMADTGDFVYMDPPYAPLSATSSFSAGYTGRKGGKAEEERFQTRIRDTALRLKRRGVYVYVSNSSAPLIYALYEKDFELVEVQAARAVNSKADRRGPVLELLLK